MNAVSYALVLSLITGTARALVLWRAAARIEVVNVVVLNALAEGRGRDLAALLRGSGSSLYLEVARVLGESFVELRSSEPMELRSRLQREAQVAVVAASRKLRRHAWLDAVALAAIVFAGINAAIGTRASLLEVSGLAAATLLWLSNVRGARSIATRIYAAASALVDSLVASRDELGERARGGP